MEFFTISMFIFSFLIFVKIYVEKLQNEREWKKTLKETEKLKIKLKKLETENEKSGKEEKDEDEIIIENNKITEQEKILYIFEQAVKYVDNSRKQDSFEILSNLKKSIKLFEKLEELDKYRRVLLPVEWIDA